MPESEIAGAVEREAGQTIPYDLADVFLDWTLLDRVEEGSKTMLRVLLVAAKTDVIDQRVEIAQAAGLQYSTLGIDSLALADAAECCDFLRVGESVALLHMGASATSIHFIKDGVSNFIRDVNWGANELVQAIAKQSRIDLAAAEKLLIESSESEEEAPESDPLDPFTEEEAAPSNAGLLDPLDEELGDQARGSARPETSRGGENSLKETLTTPIARLITEVRRSFDYYEQQLYEPPVDRLILSGGAAHIDIVRNTLADELSVEAVEVADPTQSALVLGGASACAALTERPAQFMVAVGLAARGASEL